LSAGLLSTYGAVLALSLLSVITTVLGVSLAILVRENNKAIALGIGFSTGVMLAISIFDLIGLLATSLNALLNPYLIFSLQPPAP
jgi:zinc transporter ZupT